MWIWFLTWKNVLLQNLYSAEVWFRVQRTLFLKKERKNNKNNNKEKNNNIKDFTIQGRHCFDF